MLPLRDLNPTPRVPLATGLIIAANVAVFVFVQPGAFHELAPTPQATQVEARFLYENSLVPCELTHWKPLSPALETTCSGTRIGPEGTAPFFPHKSLALSVLASMFLHANWLHLIGNLWFLWVFGDNVEARFGRVRYLGFYLIGGIVAALGQVAVTPDSIDPILGASGAIAAVLGAYLVLFPHAGVVTIILPFFFLPFILSAQVLLVVWFVLQFFTNPSSGVAWAAHVAGFVFGVLVAMIVRGAARDPVSSESPP